MGLDEVAIMTVPVSVVIPTHNSESTIERALLSVFAQTSAPLEIIVVDDASTDRTCEIVQQLAQTRSRSLRLHVLDENLGPSFTRNTGWDLASGAFVAFLDSDDTWHPMKLEIQARWMVDHPNHDVCGHLTGDPVAIDPTPAPTTDSFDLVQFLWRNRVSTPTIMIKRSVPERFDVSRWYAEDYDLWLRILCRVEAFPRIELPLTHLHKAQYGASGLSGHLFKMYRGEISNVISLKDRRQITSFQLIFFMKWMTAKFVVRLIRTVLRRYS